MIITYMIILTKDVPEMILVGNKSDVWQERQVVTDKACQVNFIIVMIRILMIIMIIIFIVIMNFIMIMIRIMMMI